jgi:DNA mismatch repair protein MutL
MQPEGQLLPGLEERWRALYHDNDALMRVDFRTGYLSEDDESGATDKLNIPVRVWGLIGAPGVSRSTRESQHLFVNQRPVENRALNFALVEGYHNTLMKGRYPVGVLFIDIPPSEVDVNIHPAKREVKFHHEAVVRQAVSQAVRQALLRYHGQSSQPVAPEKADGNLFPTNPSPPPPAPQTKQAILDLDPAKTVLPAKSAPSYADARLMQISVEKPVRPVEQNTQATRPPLETNPAITPQSTSPSPSLPTTPATPTPPLNATPLLAVPLRIIGVINNLYVVLESDRGMVLLDQHAAHERILFEQLLQRLEQGNAPSQRLLLPETVELSPKDAQFLREQLEILSRLGVELSEFGERTFLLDALPPFVKCANPRAFVLELLDELKQTGQSVNSWRLGEDLVAKTVCRKAVKANDPLSQTELVALLEDLRRCQMPYTCPHGRPTLVEMSFRELEKRFGRIQ